jgi:hypothetical protein
MRIDVGTSSGSMANGGKIDLGIAAVLAFEAVSQIPKAKVRAVSLNDVVVPEERRHDALRTTANTTTAVGCRRSPGHRRQVPVTETPKRERRGSKRPTPARAPRPRCADLTTLLIFRRVHR